MKNADYFQHEADYADLNADLAVAHLSQAIRCRTTGYVDTTRIDYTQFDRLHQLLRTSYPLLADAANWETIGHSLLITLPGTDSSLRPCLFMAHQDVVPIVPGTEADWLHDPFSGDVADGFIWGRGAIDIKQMLIAELEAAEYLLSCGKHPKRTILFAFGEDEETCSVGARALSAALKQCGISLEYVLDEGVCDISQASDWGAPGSTICPIGMYEKGYADLRLSVSSRGGHSSNPFHGTSLGILAKAINTIMESLPPACLSETVLHCLSVLAPQITADPVRSWLPDLKAHEQELLQWFESHESLYHLVRTTAAPTMIEGGSPAGNVMPQDMEAIINFRLIPSDTPDSLLDRFRQVVDPSVTLFWAQQISASIPSSLDAYGYIAFTDVLRYYFDGLTFIPTQNRGATDARWYEDLCRCVMRFGPFLEENAIQTEGMHGTNERISVRAYLQGIRVLIRMMESTCINCGGCT